MTDMDDEAMKMARRKQAARNDAAEYLRRIGHITGAEADAILRGKWDCRAEVTWFLDQHAIRSGQQFRKGVGIHNERKVILQNKRVNDAIQTALERGELTVSSDGYLADLTPSPLPATQEDAERSGAGMSKEPAPFDLMLVEKALQEYVDVTSDKTLAETARSIVTSISNPCDKIFDHKWLDPECVETGCQSLVWKSRYEAAVKGRQEFRQALREERAATPHRQEYDGEAVREALLIEARDLFRFYETNHRAKVVGFQEAYDRATDVEDRDDALSKKMDTIDKAERNKAIADKIDAALAHPAQATPSALSGDAGEGE